MNPQRFLLIDQPRQSVTSILGRKDVEFLIAPNAEIALAIMEDKPIDVVIAELPTSETNSYELFIKMSNDERLKNIPIALYRKRSQQSISEDHDLSESAETSANVIPDEGHSVAALKKENAELVEALAKRDLQYARLHELMDKLVRDRTIEVDTLNEELTTTNEELKEANTALLSINEQLVNANRLINDQAEVIIAQQRESLLRSNRNLDIIISNTTENFLATDREGRLIFFNRSFENFIIRASGKQPGIGDFLWDATTRERREASIGLFARAMSGESVEMEIEVPVEGQPTFLLIRYSPVYVDGDIGFVTVTTSDITKRRLQQEKLRASESALQSIFMNTDDSYTLLDRDLNVVAFNGKNKEQVQALTGNEMQVGLNIFQLLPRERHKRFASLIDQIKFGGMIKTSAEYGTGDEKRWFDMSIIATRDEFGQLTGYCISGHETTGIKKAESEILRLNRSLLDFQNAIHRSSIVSMTDKAGNITSVNDNFVQVSGYTREELLGHDHSILNSGYHSKAFWQSMWSEINQGRVWRGRVKNRKKDGTLYWVDTFVMPFVDELGAITQYLSIRYDITAQQLSEEELIQQKILADEAMRVSKLGYWIREIGTNEINVSKEMLRLLEVSEDEFNSDNQNLYKNVHPQDRLQLETLFAQTGKTTATRDLEFRVVMGERTRWLYQKGETVRRIGEVEKFIGTIQDVTERKTIEEVLRIYNERFEILSRASNDAIWDLDIKLNFVVWNDGIERIFGYNNNSYPFAREWWENRVHDDDRARVLQDLDNTIRKREKIWSCDFRFECADGSFKYCHSRASIVYQNDTATRVIGAMQDITERVLAMAEIEKLSFVASRTNNGVMITNNRQEIEWINEGLTRLTGYTIDDLRGKKPTILQGAETDPSTTHRISEKISRNEFVSEEIVNYTKGGKRFWLKLDIAPIFDHNNNLKNYIAIQTDITEIKEFENSITAIARELSSLIENANVPIFGTDEDGRINEWNHVASELTGFSKKETYGIMFDTLFTDSNQSFREMLSQALNDIASSNVEMPLRTNDGVSLKFLINATPRRNRDNKIAGVIFVGQDVTELLEYRTNLEKKVEERTRELHEALQSEKELVRLKSQFVSIASHEFRTPLASISIAAGYIKRYKSRLDADAIDQKLDNIEKQVNHMTFLLDDILTVGKAEAGKLQVNHKPMHLPQFVSGIVEEVSRTTNHTHQINLTEDYRYVEIVSDEKLLRNVFINVLKNAIKFSPDANRVDVTVKTEGENMHVIVQDYGIGIPANELSNMFQPFYRASNAKSIDGTGLGLSIMRKAIDMMGGSISVTSDVGVGTTIAITLPI